MQELARVFDEERFTFLNVAFECNHVVLQAAFAVANPKKCFALSVARPGDEAECAMVKDSTRQGL